MGAVPDDELRWSPAIWKAGHADVFARFRELSDEAATLSHEFVPSYICGVRKGRGQTRAPWCVNVAPYGLRVAIGGI